MISSENTEAVMSCSGATSSASAILKNTSSEKLYARLGASMLLSRERDIPAFSTSIRDCAIMAFVVASVLHFQE